MTWTGEFCLHGWPTPISREPSAVKCVHTAKCSLAGLRDNQSVLINKNVLCSHPWPLTPGVLRWNNGRSENILHITSSQRVSGERSWRRLKKNCEVAANWFLRRAEQVSDICDFNVCFVLFFFFLNVSSEMSVATMNAGLIFRNAVLKFRSAIFSCALPHYMISS